MISRPTAFEPVNVTNAMSGCSTSRGPISSPTPGRNASAPGGKPASNRISTSRNAIPGVCSAGLNTTGVAGHERGGDHAGRDREREVPRRDHDADAARLVPVRVRARPAVASIGAPSPSATARAAVVLAEVDRFAHVGVGLGERLAGFEHAQRRELVAPAAHEVGGAEQHRGAVVPRRRAPLRTPRRRRSRPRRSTWSTRRRRAPAHRHVVVARDRPRRSGRGCRSRRRRRAAAPRKSSSLLDARDRVDERASARRRGAARRAAR